MAKKKQTTTPLANYNKALQMFKTAYGTKPNEAGFIIDRLYVVDALLYIKKEQKMADKQFNEFIQKVIELWYSLKDVSISEIIALIKDYEDEWKPQLHDQWIMKLWQDLFENDAEDFIIHLAGGM